MRQANSSSRPGLLEAARRELCHALRVLVRTPAFSIIAFVTLALGIAATTAIYTVLESVVLRPLPYDEPEQLVSVLHPTTSPGTGEGKWGLASVGYFHFKENARSFADLGAYRTATITVQDDVQEPVEARVGMVTASMFTTLRARPHLGRLITPEDDRPGPPQVVVLSYEFWGRRYGEDPDIVGKMIETSFAPLRVLGVAAPGLTLPKPGPFASTTDLAGFGVDLWLPLGLDPAVRANSHQFSGVGRLRPGVRVEMAQRELAEMTRRFPELYPAVYRPGFMENYNFRVAVTPLRDEVLGPTVEQALWILFAAVGLVLVIACANVANLFLVRMESRRRESAIRTALGAGRAQMAVHFLAESLLLSLGAGAAGLLLARWAITLILATAPRSLPRLTDVGMGWTSVAFAIALSLAAGILFGLIPLARARVDVDTLRETSRGLTASRRQRILRNGLVVGQVALAVVLLISAGLMIRSFLELRNVESGLEPAGVLTFGVTLPYQSYPGMGPAAALHRRLSERIQALPEVAAVGGVNMLPLRDYGSGCSVVQREGRPYAPGEETPCVATPTAIPGVFEALGIEVRGRAPEWSDVATRSHAVVVTEALARRLWPDEDPIGKGIRTGPAEWGHYRIVGVIPELRAVGLDAPPTEIVFYAASTPSEYVASGSSLHDMEYVVKVERGDPLAAVPSIRAILDELDPRIPIVNPMAMQTIVDRSMARTSFIMLLLGLASGMALILSAVGMYGVIAYLVTQRRPEIGVRIALGARVPQVLRLIMGQSAGLAALGVVFGLVAAVALTRLLRSLLFGVSPTDPLVLVLVPLVLVGIAVLASWAPARRAAAVDPVDALRSS